MQNAPYEYSNKVYNQIKAGKQIRQIDRSRIQDAINHIKRALKILEA